MSYARLSATTAPPGLLAAQVYPVLDSEVPFTITLCREDVSSTAAPVQKIPEGVTGDEDKHNLALPDLVASSFTPIAHSIVSTAPIASLCSIAGTSMAAPRIAGLAALLFLQARGSTCRFWKERTEPRQMAAGSWRSINQQLDTASGTGSCRLPSTFERFSEVLHAYAHRLPPEHSKAFALQLHSLLSDEEELREAHIQPSLASFEGLAELLQLNPAMRHPNLSIDQQGQFVASWTPHNRAKLSLTFAGREGGTWVAADRSPDMRSRASGAFKPSDIGNILDPFVSWMSA